MAPERSRIPYLLTCWRENRCTREEFEECLQYFADGQNDPVLLEWMEEEWDLLNKEEFKVKNFDHLYPDFQSDKLLHPVKIRRISWLRIVAAASVVLILTIVGISYFNVKPQIQPPIANHKVDILPGSNKAILTLGNGTKIILDSAANGALAKQGNANIIKTDSGKLAYNTTKEKSTESIYNTLSTPRGGQYQLSLPDGTRVWLNSASSITYPTAFNRSERNVSITGEAYFEVTKDKTKPFHVKVNEMEVAVLGTHFNINAYPDEKEIKTTLFEGAVNITTTKRSKRLSPGEQASVNNNSITLTKNVDLDQVIAWKSGYFEFDKMDLPTVMRQVSRWYDVDIRYEASYPDTRFGGRISRNLKLSEILQLLETSGVHFNVENKKLTIIK